MINEDQKIIDLYKEGNSSKKIEGLTGVSATQVRRILKRNGVGARSTKTDKEIEDQIITDYNNNISSEKLAVKYKMNATTICRIVKRNDGEIKGAGFFNREYDINNNFLNEVDTQEKAYFLGFMFADGYVHKDAPEIKIELHEQDIDILKKIQKLLFFNKDSKIGVDKEVYRYFTVRSQQLVKDLAKHGCMNCKTFKVSFPKTVPEHLLSHFFRGLFDGDGCLRLNEENRAFINLTGYKAFLEEIREYLTKTLGIFVRISDYKDKPNVSDIMIHRNLDMLKMLDWLYKDATIYLSRKYAKYLDMKAAINETVEANPQHYIKYECVDSCDFKIK